MHALHLLLLLRVCEIVFRLQVDLRELVYNCIHVLNIALLIYRLVEGSAKLLLLHQLLRFGLNSARRWSVCNLSVWDEVLNSSLLHLRIVILSRRILIRVNRHSSCLRENTWRLVRLMA